MLISVEGEAEGEAMKVRVRAGQSLDEVLGKRTKQIAHYGDGAAADREPDEALGPRGQP